MSQLLYLNNQHEKIVLDNIPNPTYFGLHEGYLDMFTMKYRFFGAVWKLTNGRKYILGYWFADHENDIYCAIQNVGFINIMASKETELNEVYQSIRTVQDNENWSNRRRLPYLSIIKKPWINLGKGWYVLKSSTNYPMILTCLQKKRYSIWIEHIQVCENSNDAIKFINLINTVHNIQLNTLGNDLFLETY
jgi:hypothetical protein